ncbi:MAG TPA: ABC transporter permease [Ktedonobacteraceae bacterium]|nr:ABC transporter permease [Ktedonobacteraceae bacterium]
MSKPVSSQRSPSPEDRDRKLTNTEVGLNGAGLVEMADAATVASTDGMGTVGASPIAGVGAPTGVTGRLRDVWRVMTANRKATFGICMVAVFILVAIIGPFFVHTDPNDLSSDILQPPSAAHWLGTTQTGQDIFAQLMIGTRSSIVWGLVTGVAVTCLSVVIGLTAGYFGGATDDIISLFINIFLVLPGLPLAIVIGSYSPVKGPVTVAVVLLITSWSFNARVLRSQTLSLRKRDFVEAARASGETHLRIIFYEILPNEIALVVAGLIGTIVYVILAAATLDFLGLGTATQVDWGTMLYWAQNNDALLLGAWWWFVPPGLCIALIGTALALINYGIDEVANPRLRSTKPKTNTMKIKKAVA